MIRVTINNPRAVHLMLRGERDRIAGAVKPLVSSYGRRVRRDIIRSMVDEPKTGNIYPRPGGRLHQASAPGQAPAKDSGDLVQSIRTTLTDGGWTSIIGSPSPYAGYLEDGSKKMAKRPAWEPALDRVRKPFIEALRRVIRGF